MRAYIYPSGVVLSPWGEPASEMPVFNRPLRQYLHESLASAGFQPQVVLSLEHIPPGRALILADNCFFTPQILALVRKLERSGSASVHLGLAEGPYTKEKDGCGTFEWKLGADGSRVATVPLWLWDGPAPSPEALASAPAHALPQWSRVFIPEGFAALEGDSPSLSLVITNQHLMTLNHWSRLVDMNQGAFASWWMRLEAGHLLRLLGKGSWAALTSLSVNKWKLLGGVNFLGRKVDIHPSATVEASILGNNVSIAQNAVVTGSYLGDNVRVEPNGEVTGSVIGNNSVVCFNARAMAMVTFPKAVISIPGLQAGVLGRNARHLTACYLMDTRFTPSGPDEVRVMYQGKVVPSGKKFLGCAVGHDVLLGTGVWVNAGLEIPNGMVIVRDRMDVVTKIPQPEPNTFYAMQEGHLLPYGTEFNRRNPKPEKKGESES